MPRVSKKTIEETPTRSPRALTRAFIASLVGVGVLVVIGAVMIGRSGGGAIDVSATITEANQIHAENGGGEQVSVGNPVLQNLPNGGLVPQGTPPEQAPVVEENLATTTDASASTTIEAAAGSEESSTSTPSSEAPVPENTSPEEAPL